MSFDPFGDLDKGDALVVNLYAVGFALPGIVVAAVARASKVVARGWVIASVVVAALVVLVGAYRFFSY